MDEHSNDPYEQQLYAVFQSCLAKGETELRENNWLTLCHKLDLTKQSDELRSCIRQRKPEKQSVSFQDFRAALLTLLGKTQELVTHMDRDLTIQSERDINPPNVDTSRCGSLSTAFNNNADVLNIKQGLLIDENKLKYFLEKINVCFKENVDPTTMYFVSNCLGIPPLPKQITQCIFEKLDQNCDGLISLDEFFVIFQNRKSFQGQLMSDGNNESLKGIIKPDPKKRKNSFIRNSIPDVWKAGITNTSTLVTDGEFKASDISLADLTATLCDELKSFNDSIDCSDMQSHITLLRDFLIVYQEQLYSLNVMIENINSEKEKLRIDATEANERANSLAQEIDEQHIKQEEALQSLRKQIEQRYVEIVQDLSNQLNSEREMNAVALKSKDDQIQTLQKENHDGRNKFVNTLQENQNLEIENESLRNQIEKLKQSNNDLLTQMKVLAAEHDEIENIEMKHQQEIISLIDRIKQLRTEAVLLKDQNDELTAELETLRMRNCKVKDTRQNNIPDVRSTKTMQLEETEDKESLVGDEETDFEVFSKHSISAVSSNEEDTVQKTDLKSFHELLKQLKNLIGSHNKCAFENCAFRDEIATMISRLQSNLNTSTLKEDFINSIASEMETECEERTTESLRDFVVAKHKNTLHAKRVPITNNNNNDTPCDSDEDCNQDSKSVQQNKVSSLRDYPPRKEEYSVPDHSRASKEKDALVNHYTKVPNETKTNSSLLKAEFVEDSANLRIGELEAAHATEKKQLTERCLVLERSLDLLKTEYEECEDYWAAKLEEERQLFEQEQKISDEKFSELIAKMAEYEELISPVDKIKNGRLSPIEEKFNLEQQYLDLEEEFEKWRAQTEEEISQKDIEIKSLTIKLKALERPAMVDISLQVTDEMFFPPLSNYVPNLFNIPSSEASKFKCNENVRKESEDFKLDRILESSVLPNNFVAQVPKEERTVNDCNYRAQYSPKEINSLKNDRTGSQWKKDIDGKFPISIKKEEKYDMEFESIQNTFKTQNLKPDNCQCMPNDAQLCYVDVNILQDLNMRLQAQEYKKRQLQENFRKHQYYTEHVLHRLMSQHQVEVSKLQYLFRSTQKKLQLQYQTNAKQAEKLEEADILVKELYMENTDLMASVKCLQEHCNILMGFNGESTSI